MNKEENRKYFFYIAVGVAFLAILVLNFLTPTMSDDYFYAEVTRKAGNLLGILLFI